MPTSTPPPLAPGLRPPTGGDRPPTAPAAGDAPPASERARRSPNDRATRREALARARQDSSGDGAARRATHRWARWLHVYTSMVALVVVLFFGISGITLNHPTWTFGDDVNVRTETGSLPIATTMDDGSVDFLSISEYARDELGVTGTIDSFEAIDGDGSIAYKNPGYSADLFFDVEAGTYSLTVEQQGWVAVMNDLHKGRDTGNAWRWVIDVSAGFLVVISITGLTMQLFLRKRRRSAFLIAGLGAVLTIVGIVITVS